MKVKIKNIVDAVPALRRLNESELPLVTSYKVYRLVEEVNEILSFFSEKRDEIQRKADRKDEEIIELLEQDAELAGGKIVLPPDIHISAADIKLLMPFVEFRFEES